MAVERLDRIRGIRLDVPRSDAKRFVGLVRQSVELVSGLLAGELEAARTRPLQMAIVSAIQMANALMTAASAQCDLAAPPKDIELRPGSSGGLVYRCYHSPAHEWTLDGTRIR